jgi:putative glutamine amidotransferase
MTPKSLIGMTATRWNISSRIPSAFINQAYTKSVADSGGLPLLIPLDLKQDDLDALLSRLDGIIFTGGYDIDPQRYGNPQHAKVERVDAERDRMEIYLVQAVISAGKPFLGICRGIQVVNVALGGTLYEDLPEQHPGDVRHDNHDLPRDHLAHLVNVERNSRLAEILGSTQTLVNSLHHQGIRVLAKKLIPTAHSPDGLVEAVELPGHPFGLAVQWHPEELQEQVPMRKLFYEFIQSCQTVMINPTM